MFALSEAGISAVRQLVRQSAATSAAVAVAFRPPSLKRRGGTLEAPGFSRNIHNQAPSVPVSTPVAAKRQQSNAAFAGHERWMDNLHGDPMDHILPGGRTADSWWTGPRPYPGECAGVLEDGSITSLAGCSLSQLTRESAQQYFDNTWALTEVLFAGLSDEDAFFCPPAHGLRHPLIFYYGHVACLYINKLRVAGVLEDPINAYYEDIFETGVDEMSWDDMNKNHMEWPTIADVKDYRKKVYEVVTDLIATHPAFENGGADITMDHPLWSLAMGFEHERIHYETSAVLIRELPLSKVRPVEQWVLHGSAERTEQWSAPTAGKDFPTNEMLKVAGGPVSLGKPDDFPSFGWDNEYGKKEIESVPPFEASKFLISNGEFYEFVLDGGYQNQKYWSEDGWGWRTHRNAKEPYWWSRCGPAGLNQYRLRTTFEEIDMPWSWPADVNFHESKAFAAWKSEKDGKEYRLITEAEHHCLREKIEPANELDIARDPVMLYAGNEMPVNLNMKYASESPVDGHRSSETGHHDTAGNVWEWCEDDFYPLKGFETHDHYTDFSTPCFDGRHQMILGGAFISTGDEASVFSRFHFRPHFLQQSGFRLIESNADLDKLRGTSGGQVIENNFYDTESAMAQYLLLHFGNSKETFQDARHANEPEAALNFPRRCAETLSEAYRRHGEPAPTVPGLVQPLRALDIGCAVGGATLELTRDFNEVIGVDFSSAFIEKAREVQYRPESITYYPTQESGLNYGEARNVKIDPSLDVSRASFRTGDACNLDVNTLGGSFDAVLMANLICRLPDPTKCLESLSQEGGVGIVRPGGVAMIVTPFSWLEEYTPKGKWLWDSESKYGDSFEAMCEVLKPNFELLERRPMPLMIREHRRKWQYIVPDASIFKRVK